MKNFKVVSCLFCFLFIVILLSSSYTEVNKNRKIKQYDKFITEVIEKYKNYNEEDWKKADERFDEFCVFFEDNNISLNYS